MTLPTLAGFQWFLANVAAIDTINLPPAAPVVAFSFNIALGIVNPQLALVGIPNTTPSSYVRTQFDLAVFNLATDIVINYAIDPPDAQPFTKRPDGTPVTYFDHLRYKWGVGNFQSGVVASVSDVSTSTSLEIIEAAKTFTLSNLQNLKTPYGRQYMAIAQRYGTLWGLT